MARERCSTPSSSRWSADLECPLRRKFLAENAQARGALECPRAFPLMCGLWVISTWNTDPCAHSFLDFLIYRQFDPLTDLKRHA